MTVIFSFVWFLLSSILGFVFSFAFLKFLAVLWLVSYLIINSIPSVLGSQDLKKKYDASWAIVTGGSSGIGRSIAVSLLNQGISVVLVAQDDDVLTKTVNELSTRFSSLSVRRCGVDLSDGTGKWMSTVADVTNDIHVSLLFNNAGYILTGFFEDNTAEAQLKNFHCNVTATIHLTHHFYSKMLEKGKRGAIVFTSSAAGFIPNPFASMYGASKAAVSEFAASLAVEARAKGIDVHVVHPSPVRSRFLTGGGNAVKVAKLEMFDLAYKFAVSPEELPDRIFACIGRPTILADIGATAIIMRVMVNTLGFFLMTFGFALFAPLMPDYQAHSKKKA